MVRESSEHQAYIASRMEHGGMLAVKTEKLNICKIKREETKEKIILH
jgi:hypothetical protein